MGQNSTKKSKDKVTEKDSPLRSISKTLSWRIIATATTFIISFIIFNNYTEKTIDESINNAGLIASIEFFAKIIFYYLHERLWTNISWGTYWRKFYIGRNAWKKLYRREHEKQKLL